ncbi:Protein-lysine N-methyltransferase GPUH-LOCUS10829 [Aphelenchoides bicaudatus]|nr:Protein-lysine N-methyltransferase GPUH-LOCUS10829 [Aphelenchoides bicaudatus]
MEVDEQPNVSNQEFLSCGRCPVTKQCSCTLKHSETDSDSDDYRLSDDVLAMVREVTEQKQEMEQSSGTDVAEDWSLSQFWYTEESMNILANEVLAAIEHLKPNAQIACLSCPTLYQSLLRVEGVFTDFHPSLYEFDTRFQAGNEEHFVHFDYNKPLDVPGNHFKRFDMVIADPPHLSDACFVSYGLTINSILKDRQQKVIFCTGVKMADLIHRLFKCRETTFKPEHRNKLGNLFGCFTNYRPHTFEWLNSEE